jgi:MFS family permease
MSHANPYQPPPSPSAGDMPPGSAGGWLYYGWVIVPLAALAMAATLPGRTHGLGLITKRMLEDLHVEPATFAWMNLAATLVGAAFCLPCGWMLDRFGIRNVLGGVLLLLGLAVVWLSQVTHPLALLASVTLTRGLGQSMLSVVSITMVGKWFNRRLGPAMGVYSVLMSMMMATITGVMGSEILRVDWRDAWLHLGYVLLLIVPPAWLIARNAPREPGREFAAAGPKQAGEVPGATLWQALATPSFWVFSLSISFFGLVSSGLSLFNQYVLEERGFPEAVFHRVLIVGLVTGMVTNLVVGGLAKVLPLQRLLCFGLLVLTGALTGFPFVRSELHVYLYAVANGVAGGFLTVLFFSVWGHAFGPAQLGKIQAAAQMLTVLASAAGPVLVAVSKDYTGSYLQVFSASAAVAGLFAVIAFFTPVPNARAGAWARWQKRDEELVPALEKAG